MTDRTGLLTDRYELTMLDSWVRDGSVDHECVFETFARRLPEGRRYGVLGGLGRLLPMIEDFRFSAEEIDWLREDGVIGAETAAYLAGFRFRGDVDGYREGELYFPHSPVLTVTGTLGECVVLETLVLSVLNHDSAIASAAARMVLAAGDRPLIEMGGRRTHERAAIAAARTAYLTGFAASSNLAAGRIWGIPTVGTVAHAFVLGHASEESAFRSQVEAMGPSTTILVDTYDIAEGIRTAVQVAGAQLGAVRIDSGDLAEEAGKARALLDELGATGTKVVATSDLDEYALTALADAPIDSYGVGTRLVTGSGHPTAEMVYKLVAVADSPGGSLRPVAKESSAKQTVGGRKSAWRAHDDHGFVTGEFLDTSPTEVPSKPRGTPLQVPLVRAGEVVHSPSADEIRDFARDALATLPTEARSVAAGAPYLTARTAGEEEQR